jgi:hypothetical protein
MRSGPSAPVRPDARLRWRGVVEAFPDELTRGHDHSSLIRSESRQPRHGRTPLADAFAAHQHHEARRMTLELAGEQRGILAPFCEYDGRAALADGSDDVIQDAPIAAVVVCQDVIDLSWPQLLLRVWELER